MVLDKNTSRRKVLKTWLAALAAGAVAAPETGAVPKAKAPGEIKVVALMGDYWHNGVAQEIHVRSIFSSKKNWRIHFLRASRFLTADMLNDTDLLILARYGGSDAVGWSTEGIADSRVQGDSYMTDEQETAIIDNVMNRGMAFMAVHCTLFCGREKIEDLMGIEPLLHQEIQPLILQDINQEHPITKGIKTFFVNLDEQFDVQIKDPAKTTILFRTLAAHDKRNAISGWCLEQGRGRIVGLLPGHTQWPYRIPEYQEIFWRSAHWVLRREIPSYPKARKQ